MFSPDCPACGSDELVEVTTAIVESIVAIRPASTPSGEVDIVEISDPDYGEQLDRDRDDAKIRCQDCGWETDDPNDFDDPDNDPEE